VSQFLLNFLSSTKSCHEKIHIPKTSFSTYLNYKSDIVSFNISKINLLNKLIIAHCIDNILMKYFTDEVDLHIHMKHM
jgi:hypothetical protein